MASQRQDIILYIPQPIIENIILISDLKEERKKNIFDIFLAEEDIITHVAQILLYSVRRIHIYYSSYTQIF